jgi:hypothetical protein
VPKRTLVLIAWGDSNRTDPGPPAFDHCTFNVPFGLPSSLAVPFSTNDARKIAIASPPALTTGA